MHAKIALVCDWLTALGGAERVLQSIYRLYRSPIYCLVQDSQKTRELGFNSDQVFTSFIQKLPNARGSFRNFLPLFPRAIEQFNLSQYEIILSSSHSVAKGVKKSPEQLHICYCHTPVRYAWDLYPVYLNSLKGIKRQAAKPILKYIRRWDFATTDRVDHFIANSKYVAKRIEKNYGRKATVIYPPVQTKLFYSSENREEFYLTVSRLVPYKKIDLIAEVFSKTPNRRLIIIGEGPELERIREKAKKNVEFLGFQADEVVRDYMSRAKAFVFAAEEDFGISPLEAQASGTPVIAFNKGGTAETVQPNRTGILFEEQTVHSMIKAIDKFENQYDTFDPVKIQQWAYEFREERFLCEFQKFVEKKYEEHQLVNS